MMNRVHARLLQRTRTRGTGWHWLSRLTTHSTAQPYGGSRRIVSQGWSLVSITNFECSFTRAPRGFTKTIRGLCPCHPWLLRGFAESNLPIQMAGLSSHSAGTTHLPSLAYMRSYRGSASLAASAEPSLPDMVSCCQSRRFQIPEQTLLPTVEQS